MVFSHAPSRKGTFLAAVLALSLAATALAPAARAGKGDKRPPASRIVGQVLAADGKRPLRRATVRSYHLETGVTYTSRPTDRKGAFRIDGLPFGYFEIAVETADGLFVGSETVSVPPSGKALVLMRVLTYAELDEGRWSDYERREFAGSARPSTGVADLRRKLRGAEFWKSPKGVAILAGAGTAVLIAIAAGAGDDETPASPSLP